MISKETIDKIFDACRIEEVVGDFVTLKKRGVNLIGLCPFHNEKTPSFNVSQARGIYKCFGCGKGGNAVNFVMEHEHMTYPDALKYLARKYNIEIEEKEQSPEEKIIQDEKESLYVVTSFAQKHFSENLFNTDEGKSIGLSYFKERGFRQDIIEKFQLGYCLDKRRGFTDAALAEAYKMEFMVKTGLTIQHEKNQPQQGEQDSINENPLPTTNNPPPTISFFDRFSARVMFPIHNVTGRVIGFGGRTLKNDKKMAKYLNSPESEIYHKSKVLYGLYFAKKMIIAEENCFLVEGYTDVISMHQAGIENVVSSSGTSLTVDQIRLIKRYTPNITILYDGDMAGIKASFRGIDMILEEGMNVRVLLFPDGDDPDSYSKKVGTEELKKFIKENSKNFVKFKTSVLLEELKEAKNDPYKKTQIILEVANTIAIIPDAFTRSSYTKDCSSDLHIDEQTLIFEVNKIGKKRFFDKSAKEQKTNQESRENLEATSVESTSEEEKSQIIISGDSTEYQERDIIRILLNHGSKTILLEDVDENDHKIEVEHTVADFMLTDLRHDGIIFDHPGYRKIHGIFNEHFLDKELTEPIHMDVFLTIEDEEIKNCVIDILATPYTLANWDKHSIPVTLEENILKRSAQSALYSFKMRRLEMMINENQKQLKESKSEEDALILIAEQQILLQAKTIFSAQLGRVVIK